MAKMKVRHIGSFGGGVNTGGMIAILQLKGITIDEWVWCDTGNEDDRTYKWIEEEVKPFFKLHNTKLTIIQSKYGNMYDYYYDKKIIPPASTRECTDKFKIQPIMKYIKEKYPNDVCFVYIGYDADEPERAYKLLNKKDGRKYRRMPYYMMFPLLQYNIGRERCKKLIQGLGLKIPPKSRCIICPFRKEKGFEDLYLNEPHNFIKAMKFEENNSRFHLIERDKTPWCLLANKKRTLRKLKSKWDGQRKLSEFLPIPRMMLEYKPISDKQN